MLAEFSASRRPGRRYRVVKRLALALAPSILAMLLSPLAGLAEDQPYKTVVDGTVPRINGLTIQGATGGCDLLVQNLTGQAVTLFDMSKPAKPFGFVKQGHRLAGQVLDRKSTRLNSSHSPISYAVF